MYPPTLRDTKPAADPIMRVCGTGSLTITLRNLTKDHVRIDDVTTEVQAPRCEPRRRWARSVFYMIREAFWRIYGVNAQTAPEDWTIESFDAEAGTLVVTHR